VGALADLQEDIPPQRAAELVREGAVQLVDVREPYEHDAGRIAGARHVELTRLTEEAGSIDRDRPVLFYCRVGNRSAMATQAFRAAGFDAYNLEGGLVAWARAALPLEPEDGVVADH
jgi:rhodanese-related sulfurtransferase